MHPTCIEGEGLEALVCVAGFCRGYYRRGCNVSVVSSGLFGDLGMCGGGGLLGCECREFGYVSVVWGLGMVVPVVGLRACVAGYGFQALHWNMLSWSEFGRCTRV